MNVNEVKLSGDNSKGRTAVLTRVSNSLILRAELVPGTTEVEVPPRYGGSLSSVYISRTFTQANVENGFKSTLAKQNISTLAAALYYWVEGRKALGSKDFQGYERVIRTIMLGDS